MLGNSNAVPTIAVKDVEAAKKFYSDVLGLELLKENVEGLTYKSGDSRILVYPSSYAGSNKATYAGWSVDNIETAVEELKSKGVQFEHYDFPGSTLEGDIHVMGDIKGAWFTDPDGNILALDQQR
jgi:catechol 2,3-dioxygenase-like lactoylglutathione lyase family enzyme